MKVVLTIAGSDSSGGAGIQADIKSFEAFGVFGMSVITVLTAQNTQGVTDIYPVSPQFIQAQIDAIFNDFEVSAIKIGMLYSNEIIDVVRETIKGLDIPIVFDPVFISKAGSKLLSDDAIENMKSLFEYVTVTTPNIYEAQTLFGYQFAHTPSLEAIFNMPCSVVIKNHKMEINNHYRSVDTMYTHRDKRVFDTPYIEKNSNTHGTGCSFSSAIAANLALGKSLEEAVAIAKKFVYVAINNAPQIGEGKGPIWHKKGGEICRRKRA
ncbi:MAG: bifunctional hydroxymethylpyrimidine kinase/phosphomethylpyrimidine kinase [Campylobacterales bacterium]|nr:bifunctional hydroxymethylpyrimidine kinase/phosphomethylpyrimidine kinase [Campylobacterales bacterium]